jgi:tRNA pseudouridine38-40 synthase
MRNIHIKIEYDGSAFHGWQFQPNVRTVQATVEEALSIVCLEEIHVNGTSRTDAGVHAYGQHATFPLSTAIPVERIPIAANNLLEDARIVWAREEDEGFHARYDAIGKKYIYRIAVPPRGERENHLLNDGAPHIDIFLRNYLLTLNEKLDIPAMQEAGKAFVGTHDFASFQAAGSKIVDNTVRTIEDLSIEEHEREDTKGNNYKELLVSVTGDGFLYNMVRIIVGTLLAVGRGRKAPEDIKGIIEAKDRTLAGPTASPCGLYLFEVYYSKEE